VSQFSRSRSLVGGAVLTVTLAACAGGGGGGGGGSASDTMADMDPVTLSYHYLATPQSHQGQAAQAMADWVAEKSDGKITIEPYPSGSLLKAGEEIEGVGSGLADMGVVIASYEPQELPISAWFNQLNPLASSSMPNGLLQLIAGTNIVMNNSDAIQDEWQSQGVQYLGANVAEVGYGLGCTERMTTPAEAEGVTARVGGPPWDGEVAAMGFEPVSLVITEAYEALQRRAVDCVVGSPSTQRDYGFWEVAPFFIPVSASTNNAVAVVINQDRFDQLPADAQELIQEAANVNLAASLETTLENYRIFAEEGPVEHSIEIVDPSALNEQLDAYQETRIDELIANAPAGIDDPEAFVAEYREAMERGLSLAEEATGETTSDNPSVDEIVEGYISGPDLVDAPAFIDSVREASGGN
jgi:TRAP-type C4-dicarboxylate transport system substrate-binding protein